MSSFPPLWTPFSWEQYPVTQAINYPDKNQLNNIVVKLQNAPPLVTHLEIVHLKKLLIKAAKGEAFILQGGDCSELFADCDQIHIASKFDILLKMAEILVQRLKKSMIRIGRIAGQYAKPRSSLTETLNGVTLPAYRGDMINGYAFNEKVRQSDPERMLEAYHYSGLTLNYLRALSSLKKIDFFTSHEALHLPYEAALTRETNPGVFYNLSTHFPWIGIRTLHTNSAHIEYLRGIQNPIGIKVGPHINLDELSDMIGALNPNNVLGKIVLIHRFGKAHIVNKLPPLLAMLVDKKIACTVICDPMHGNTAKTQQGIKTRYVNDILEELYQAFIIHKASTLPLAGIHFEMTGENVTECVGGSCGLKEDDLNKTYMSLVDPRLNYSQALEMAHKIAEWHQ